MSKINLLITDDDKLIYSKLLPHKYFIIQAVSDIQNSELLKITAGFDCMIIKSSRKIDRHFISNCSLKLIATASRGVDHIDMNYAKKKGLKILFSEGANCISTAEHTMALILEIHKRIKFADTLIREGKFSNLDFERRELFGKKIGIIGIGKVGSHVAKLAGAFGMKIYANDTDKKVRKCNKLLDFRSLEYILKNADVVSVHIPLNSENLQFFSKNKLNLLNKNSVLINTSRGKVIDEFHLIKLLKNKRIKFAGLDVFWDEPFINNAFLGLENVILTNHIAGKTLESKSKIRLDIISQIKNFYLKN